LATPDDGSWKAETVSFRILSGHQIGRNGSLPTLRGLRANKPLKLSVGRGRPPAA